jgi:cytochrome c-type biogenesis protein
MIATAGVYGLSLLAGVLSTLSPCVLSLIPILVGSALTTHRYGPYALATGVALSFTVVGVFVASLGVAIGLDQAVFRTIAAVLLILFGVILFSATLQEKFAAGASAISGSGFSLSERISTDSLWGQFLLGLLLGIVWSPCVGPTLGATITLASQGQNLSHVTLVMALFGLGAALPLILLGLLSRQAMMKLRNRLFMAGVMGKKILGIFLFVLGILIITGTDKTIETWLLEISPDWLVHFTISV